MNTEKAIKIAKKLKALADRGVGGEAESARRKLDAVLKRYNIKLEDVGEETRVFERTTLNEGSVILEKIIKAVSPEAEIIVKRDKTKLIIEVQLSDLEFREISNRYRLAWKNYNKRRKLFLSAYLNSYYNEFFAPPIKYRQPPPSPFGVKVETARQKPSPPKEDKGEEVDSVGNGAAFESNGESVPSPQRNFNREEEREVRSYMTGMPPFKYVSTLMLDNIHEKKDFDFENDYKE